MSNDSNDKEYGLFIPGAKIEMMDVYGNVVHFTCTDEVLYDDEGNEVIRYSFEDLTTFG